jgi:hypothetical protein
VSLIATALLYLFVVFGLYMLMAHNHYDDSLDPHALQRAGLQKIIVTYAAALGSIGDLKARGPAMFRGMTGWLSPVSGSLSLGFYPIKCALGLHFYAQTWGTVALPIVIVATYSVVRILVHLFKGLHISNFQADWKSSIVVVLYYTYPPIVKTLLSGGHIYC